MMKTKFLFFFSVAVLFAACTKVENNAMPPQCDESATDFKTLYNGMANDANYVDVVTMDTEIHAFDFEVIVPSVLCKIGYQSLPDFNATPYEIEIIDNSNGNTIYFGSHVFGAATTTYESIGQLMLEPGVSYTIKRIQTNWNDNIGNTIGRLVMAVPSNQGLTALNFPVTQGQIIITGSSFYGNGGPNNNWAIPFIDLVFE